MNQEYYAVSILTEEKRFAMRMGFGDEPSGLSNLILSFLLKLLDAVKVEKPEGARYDNTHECQFGTYREQRGQESKFFYVTEDVYLAVLDLRCEIRQEIETYRSNAEALGSNFLIQQLRQDVIGAAVQ